MEGESFDKAIDFEPERQTKYNTSKNCEGQDRKCKRRQASIPVKLTKRTVVKICRDFQVEFHGSEYPQQTYLFRVVIKLMRVATINGS